MGAVYYGLICHCPETWNSVRRMEGQKMNVLSMFDGISCGQLALQRAGKKVDNYYASEIDKYAIKVAIKNFPDIVELGDVRGIQVSNLPKIDLVIGGSPCQSFSIAGNGTGFEGKSGLFYEFVRVLNDVRETNPDVLFLLENVKMKKEWQDTISKLLGVEPIEINSALLSAQNRRRLYWTNIPGVTQPEDKGIILKDILESGVTDRQKSFCIDASYFKGGNLEQYFGKSRRQLVFLSEKELERAREKYRTKVWASGKRMGNMKFPDDVNKKSRCLTATVIKGARETIHVQDADGVRILTNIECERLQTLPDNYTDGISNTQRYKSIGNGWTVDVIAHIFSNII
jgi:site-specific DNA-cytosine methylase